MRVIDARSLGFRGNNRRSQGERRSDGQRFGVHDCDELICRREGRCGFVIAGPRKVKVKTFVINAKQYILLTG